MATNNIHYYKTGVKSAVVIIPPEELWGPIQEIRKIHDKAYKRWMPHINMLYPFVNGEHFEAVVDNIRQAISSITPFKVSFKNFNYFNHGAVWLQPQTENNNVVTLQSLLERAFPYCNDLSKKSENGFTPHLSVGQWPKKDLKTASVTLQKGWKDPIEFTVNEICMISREGFEDPFRVVYRVPLGGSAVQLVSPIPTVTPEKSPSSKENSVFVGNLPLSITEQDLERIAKEASVNPIKISVVVSHGKPKGFAFMEFATKDEATEAITKMDGCAFNGRDIKVQPAK